MKIVKIDKKIGFFTVQSTKAENIDKENAKCYDEIRKIPINMNVYKKRGREFRFFIFRFIYPGK